MAGAKNDLRHDQRREKREERRERRGHKEAGTERRGKREESRDKREEIMSRVGDLIHGIEASQDHDDKQKREERREEREERREKKADRPKETARGPQMRPPEVPTRGAGPFLHHAAPQSVVDRRLESLHFKGGS